MIIKRQQYYLLKKRIKEKRKFIQVVVGPRQVGKTTLVNQLTQHEKFLYYYVSADSNDAINSYWISMQWDTARIKLKNSKAKQLILIIDEIQKINNWSKTVKAEWDKDTRDKINIKTIILGSSSLLIQKGLTESLAGRYEKIYMPHWSYTEINEAFDTSPQKYAWFGGYPGSYDLIKDENRWKEYIKESLIETTVSKDILMLNRIDKPALLKRLFELGCIYSGQILSYNKMLGQLHDAGNTVTLSHYLNLLSNAGLLTGLEKYSIKKIRQRASSPKFQIHNTAFISAQTNESLKQILSQPIKWGRIIESTVGAHLVNYSQTENFNLYYWRHNNYEIDFVLSLDDKIIGLEIKSGGAHKISGMNEFSKMINPQKILLIGDKGLPWQEFLKMNPLNLF